MEENTFLTFLISKLMSGLQGFVEVFRTWIARLLARHKDVYFVTNFQTVLWMTNPVGSANLAGYEDWKEKCKVTGQPVCR